MELPGVAQAAIIAAFKGPLKPFLKDVTYTFLQGNGDYDPVTDTVAQTTTTVGPFKLPCLRPTNEDAKYGADSTHQKIIVPANYFPLEPLDSDKLVVGGETWTVFKVVETPGNVIYTIYARRT